MTRRAVPLTGAEVERLPEPCRTCVFWELGAKCPEPRTTTVLAGAGADPSPSRPTVRKQAWVSSQVQRGTPPGRLAVVDGEVVGYALFGPAGVFARRGAMVPTPSDDALLLATAWVERAHREAGIGRLLVQAAIKEALRLDLAAVEVFGDRRWQERGCVLPITWLLHEGFEVHREHLRTPLLRLETRRTVRWADSLEHAWEEVLGRLPRRVPVGESVPQGVPAPNGAGVVTPPEPDSRPGR